MIRGRAWGSLLVSAGLCVSGLSGCSAILSNQSVSSCFRAIPIGQAAVHDPRDTMVDVHRLPADKVLPHLPPEARAELKASDDTTVCAMTFKGTFKPGQVELAPATESGSYAIVLVTSDSLKLLVSAVTKTAPRGFGGRSAI